MRPFNEVLREAKQGNRPAVEVSQIDPEEVVKPGADAAKKGYNLYRKGKKLADFSNPGDKK